MWGDEQPLGIPGAWGSKALFRTLKDLSVISSAGTGSILYDPAVDFDGGLSADLTALAASRTLGISFAEARRYVDEKGPHRGDPARSAYVRAYRECEGYVSASLAMLKTNPEVILTLGVYAASVALHRLKFTFFSAHLLYQLRLRFEADAVARQLLEQIAWAVAASEFDDVAAIDRVQPHRSIGRLRDLAPVAGRLYGLLSKSTHAGVEHHRAVFAVDDQERGIVQHGMTDWSGSAAIMLTLADLWVIAHENTQRKHLSELVATDPARDYRPDPNRAFLATMRSLLDEINTLETTSPEAP